MGEPVQELLIQALETALAGVRIYTAAVERALDDDLKWEWTKYLDQMRRHVEVVQSAPEVFGIDPGTDSAGLQVVKHIGESLVTAINMARQDGPPQAAELVACECVTLAETEDHSNWELLRAHTERANDTEQKRVLAAACDEVEEQEDEHLYHSKGWCRELWIQSLGLPAVLLRPEERKDVKTAIGSARAEQPPEELLEIRRVR